MPEELDFEMERPGTELYDITGAMGEGLRRVYETSLELVRKAPSVGSLRRISRGIMLEGKVKYIEFRRRMREITGELWELVKGFVKDAWNAAKEWNKRVGEKGRIVLTRGTPNKRLVKMMRDGNISSKEALAEKQNLKDQLLKGVKSGEFEGAVRFGNVYELKNIVKTKRLAISDEYGVIHAQPILGKEDTTFAAYGSYSKHNMAMIIPEEFVRADPEAKTKEVLIDPKTPVERITFLVGQEDVPIKFDDLVGAERENVSGVTLDSLGFQQLWEAIANRLTADRRESARLTKQAIKRREKKAPRATEVDINDIRGLGNYRGLEEKEVVKIAKNMFGFRRGLDDLTKEEADQLKERLILTEPREVMENEKIIYDDPDIKDSTKKALKRVTKIYDVSDSELGDYLIMWTEEGKRIINKDVNNVIASIKMSNELRHDQGKVIWAYLAPIKRLLGEPFIAEWRNAEVQKLEIFNPESKEVYDVFHGLELKSREAIWRVLDGQLGENTLSPKELEAHNRMRELYKKWWKIFDIPGFIEQYAPHLPKFRSHDDMINWAFSRKGLSEFDFWAKHERVGKLDAMEMDARKVALAYLRAGLANKFYKKAQDNVAPMIEKMSPERQTLAKRWIETVIEKKPTGSEKAAERLVKALMKKAGVKVDEDARYYRQLVGVFLDMNYSAYMGLRPKLALRNLTQQVLIMNEYGYGAWLRGLAGKGSKEVKGAMEKSNVYKLRKQQYLVMEEEVGRISEIPAAARQKMMWFYRKADIMNVEAAFSTGFLAARKLRPNLPESLAIRAGEKAIHNTQWGYGMDLPYLFKTPTGKFVSQYMSWSLWYADHLARIGKERQGGKAARTIAQAAVIYALLENFDLDYTRTVLFGAMPQSLGFGPQSLLNFVALIGSMKNSNYEEFEKALGTFLSEIGGGITPGYLVAKDIKRASEGDISELFLYKKKKKSRSGKGLGSLGSMGKLGSL